MNGVWLVVSHNNNMYYTCKLSILLHTNSFWTYFLLRTNWSSLQNSEICVAVGGGGGGGYLSDNCVGVWLCLVLSDHTNYAN